MHDAGEGQQTDSVHDAQCMKDGWAGGDCECILDKMLEGWRLDRSLDFLMVQHLVLQVGKHISLLLPQTTLEKGQSRR